MKKIVCLLTILAVFSISARAGNTSNPGIICPKGQTCSTATQPADEDSDMSSELFSAYLGLLSSLLSAIN